MDEDKYNKAVDKLRIEFKRLMNEMDKNIIEFNITVNEIIRSMKK